MSKGLAGLLKPITKPSKLQLAACVAALAIVGSLILIISHAAPNPNLQGDLNNDNVVNATDLSILLTNFNSTNVAVDINGDGHVNALDLSILLSHYGQSYSGGTVLFDGRASQMSSVDVHEVAGPGTNVIGPITWSQSPYGTHYFYVKQAPTNTWSCLCFIKNDLTLVADPTFGKVFNAAVATGDTNEWQGSQVIDGAGQVSESRPQADDLGKWNWFSMATKVPSWNGPIGDLFFADIGSFGYQTSEGNQVGLNLVRPNSGSIPTYNVEVNAGYIDRPIGAPWTPGSTSFDVHLLPVAFGQWDEWVIGVKGATDNTGGVQIYHRTLGGSWTKVFDRENIPTELYGTIGSKNYADDGSNWSVIDKVGLYFHEYGGESESVQESGLTRSSDLQTAESTLP